MAAVSDRGPELGESFAAFVRTRWTPLLRLAYAVTQDVGRAEDVVQEAFVRLCPRWRRLRDEDPDGYVRRFVVTQGISAVRRPWRRGRPTHTASEQALAALPARQRAVVVLRFVEDLTDAQVADLMRCTVRRVKAQATRGRSPPMSGGRPALREVVDAGPPGYQPPADPYPRVADAVRRRQARRRGVALGVATAAAAAAVPLVRGVVDPSDAPVIAGRGSGWPGYLVAHTDAGPVYATTSLTSNRCLFAPGLDRSYVCFDVPRPVDWVNATQAERPRTMGAILGVTDPAAAEVRVRLSDGALVRTRTVGAPTTRDARFFAVQLPVGGRPRELQVFDADAVPLAPALRRPPV